MLTYIFRLNMKTLEYRHNFPLEAADVAAVFAASGIRRPTDDLDRIRRMLNNADLILSAWHKSRLIGICRALTDFSYCCYLSDLAVIKTFQKQGVGRELIDRVRAIIGDEVTLVLVAAPKQRPSTPRSASMESKTALSSNACASAALAIWGA